MPRELFEAAAVDGANPFDDLPPISFPIVRPIFVMLTVLSVIWDSNVFNQVWFLPLGNGPGDQRGPPRRLAVHRSLRSQQYGLGAAVAVVTVLLLLIVTGYYIRIMVRTGEVQT